MNRLLLISVFLILGFQTAFSQVDFRRGCVHTNTNDVLLSWIPPNDPCGKFLSISIYAKQNNLSPYVLVDSITSSAQSNYLHSGAAAQGKTWSYYLVYKYLCDDSEQTTDTLLLDLTQPAISEIDTVSYDPFSGFWQIGWTKNPAPDLRGYIVWEASGSNNTVLDSVVDEHYLDSSSNPLGSAKSYRVSAFDSCINQSVISSAHRPIHLQVNGAQCNTLNTLSWNSYLGKTSDSFALYCQGDLDPDFNLDTTLDAGESNYSFTLSSGESKTYYLRVFFSDGTSSRTNPVSITASPLFNVDSNYLVSASCNDNTGNLEVFGMHHTANDWDSVYLFRENPGSNIPVLGFKINSLVDSYLHSDAGAIDTLHYRYKQELVDRCGRRYASNVARNIVLRANEVSTNSYALSWNSYEEWLNGVGSYSVFVGDPFQGSTWNLLQTVGEDSSVVINYDEPTADRRCFIVSATEDGQNTFNFLGLSQSNSVCFVLEPEIYFPNAFAPYGINNTYIPVGISIDKNRSNIKIFSQTGQLVWDSDLNQPWTGFTSGGVPYNTNTFAYYAVIQFINGDKKAFSGNITVLY